MRDNAASERISYSDRVTSPKKSARKMMNEEFPSCIIVEAPLWSTLLPRVLVEALALYPQRPEPVSSSEGTRTDGWPPREYSTVIVWFEPTTSCVHERMLSKYVSLRQQNKVLPTYSVSGMLLGNGV